MYFMFLKIIDIKYKTDIFMALESVDITKASYFDGYNLEKVLGDDLAIFKGFFREIEEKDKKIILVTAYVQDKNQIKDFLKILKEAGVQVNIDDILRVLLIPVAMVFDSKMGEVDNPEL